MQCPYCDEELEHVDTFGTLVSHSDNFKTVNYGKEGDIYKCNNKECRSKQFDYYFYSKEGQDKLFAGYPCRA